MIPKYHINLFWSEPDGAWVADVPDLQSCSAFGDTPAEALAEIEQAIEAWLAVAREDGLPIPERRYRAPAGGVESVQGIDRSLFLTLTDIADLEANVSDGWKRDIPDLPGR
jgi:predicted RNase H-like HicB family nuclease